MPRPRPPPTRSPAPHHYRAGIERHDLETFQLARILDSPDAHDQLGGPAGSVVVVTGSGGPGAGPDVDRLADLPALVVAHRGGDEQPAWADVASASDDELDGLVAIATAHPQATVALAVLLRGQAGRSIGDGLAAESAVYSTLQAGPEFAAWRRSRPAGDRPAGAGPVVRSERIDDRLVITLDRPEAHNAFSAAMRDQLLEALVVAELDPSIQAVELRGAGPSFCSGGDLDEFGSRPDPATAHLVRLTRHAGRAIARIAGRTTAHVHGATIGSGIELAAFAGRIVADPDTRIALPELGLGLVPGAGGTVSLTRRIGRHATMRLALMAEPLDARTALAWGLVDEIA